jgi:hypothetical protein
VERTDLKLKQASAVLGVPPKDLQNLVQHGVIRPDGERASTTSIEAPFSRPRSSPI